MSKKAMMKEQYAELAHQMWSGWMEYMFSKCNQTRGGMLIPFESEQRWKRQMLTDYADLPESEKENDRAEANKMMKIVSSNFHHFDSDDLLWGAYSGNIRDD